MAALVLSVRLFVYAGHRQIDLPGLAVLERRSLQQALRNKQVPHDKGCVEEFVLSSHVLRGIYDQSEPELTCGDGRSEECEAGKTASTVSTDPSHRHHDTI